MSAVAEAAPPPAMLALDGVEVAYDRIIVALRGVSLEVPEGAIVALLGANGAGKTTTLKAASGLLGAERGAVTRGTIRYRGRDVVETPPRTLVREGLVQVLEGRHCFLHLTVDENLRAGALARGTTGRALREDLDRVYAQFPRLVKLRRARAGLTSGGEQQMVAIGRALMARPSLVLLDEPSMGLAPQLVEEIFQHIRTLNRETQHILREAREAGNHAIALGAISRAEKQLELEARLLGELDDRVKVAVGVSVEANNSQHLGALLAEVMLPSELEDIRNRLMAACARKVNSTTDDMVATYQALPSGE